MGFFIIGIVSIVIITYLVFNILFNKLAKIPYNWHVDFLNPALLSIISIVFSIVKGVLDDSFYIILFIYCIPIIIVISIILTIIKFVLLYPFIKKHNQVYEDAFSSFND